VTVDVNTLNGYFKRRYGELMDAIPSDGNTMCAQRIRFEEGRKIGDSYHEDVRLGRSMGWTFAGGALAGTAYALNAARSGQTQAASVAASSFVLREQIAYDVVSRAQNSMQAFGKAFDDVVGDMTSSSHLAREVSLLYGQDDIGAIEVIAGAGTSRTWTMSKATSSAGLWWQLDGAALDSFDPTLVTQRNANAEVAVTSIDLDASGRVVVSVTGNAADLTATLVGDVLVPLGANGNMMLGIAKIAKTTTGTLYGINVATFPLWKSTTHDAGTASATIATLMHALKVNRLKSGAGKRTAMVSTATWTDLNNNTTVLQRFLDSKQRSGVEYGTESIAVENAQVSLEIVEHPLLKEGEAYIADYKKFKRIGSRDHSWNIGAPGQQPRFFRELPDNAGFELRCYWDQGQLCRMPNCVTRIENLVNSV